MGGSAHSVASLRIPSGGGRPVGCVCGRSVEGMGQMENLESFDTRFQNVGERV